MRGSLLVLLGLAGCVREACVHTQQAVAVRTYDCTGSWDIAEGRASLLAVDPNQCLNEESTSRTCAKAIHALTCKEVLALGDDLGAWMEVDPSCGEVFSVQAAGIGDDSQDGDAVTLQETCDCPPATVGEEIDVLLVNERDEDLRIYAVPPDDCAGDLQSTAWTLLAGGVGTVRLPDEGVYHMVPVGALNETRGCFTASPDLTVRVPADR